MTLLVTIALPIGGVLVVAYVVWRLLFGPLFQLHDKMSIDIASKVYPEIQSSHNSLTALSAAAIVLTFTILEFYSKDGIEYKAFLITSWVSFALAVIFGIVGNILIYSFSVFSKILINTAMRVAERKEEVSNSDRSFVDEHMPRTFQTKKFIFIALYMQSIAFLVAVSFLSTFAILNVR